MVEELVSVDTGKRFGTASGLLENERIIQSTDIKLTQTGGVGSTLPFPPNAEPKFSGGFNH